MLKKLIVVMVVFALITGTAFAQASLGGQLMIGTTFLSGNGDSDDVNMGGQQYHEAKMSANFGDGKGGGKLVFTVGNDTGYDGALGPAWKRAWGFLFWRPAELFRMQVGVNADGDFGAAQISGWGFTGEAKNSVGAVSDYNGWGNSNWPLYVWQSGLSRKGNAFYPGTGDLINVNLSFFPVDGLQANIVLPVEGVSELSAQISDLHIHAKYNIEEVGIVNVAFIGKGGIAKDSVDKASAGNIYASFFLNAIQGIGAELGLVFGLPWEDAAKQKQDGFLGIGAGFRYDDGSSPFTFKFRINARVAGFENDNPMSTQIYANILPCYKINNNIWAFFYAGIGMEAWEKYIGARVSWFINPYIWVRAAEGLRFWTGLQIVDEGLKADKFGASADSSIVWRIPFGFNFYF